MFLFQYIDISNRPSLVYGHKNSTNPIIVTDSDSTDNNRVTAECISLQIYKTVGRQVIILILCNLETFVIGKYLDELYSDTCVQVW